MRAYEGPEFVKGHGTENDFVLLPDPEGELDLTTERVRALCDRRRGLGADGVLRVVRNGALDIPLSELPAESWFMDYRNADGSVVEMCGNGVRVFATYLVEAGWAGQGQFVVGTRSGPKPVTVRPDGQVTVDMGPARIFGLSDTSVGPHDFKGVAVEVGNPHLACVTDVDVDTLALDTAPAHDAELFPAGVNVEFLNRLDADQVRMRVFERGVGETRSCGTGTVAATVAALHAEGADQGRRTVRIPGGAVEVTVTAETTTLTGPAVLVGGGRLDATWWREHAQD